MQRQISIRLPERTLKKLEQRARRSRRTRAEVVREALEAFLEYPPGTFELTPFERVREHVRAVRGLPRDLAMNPAKYMADFGGRR